MLFSLDLASNCRNSKVCEDLQYIGAMGHPGGGKNDIPNRLKRNFFMFNLVLPSITSINDIYGQMLRGRFKDGGFDADVMKVSIQSCTKFSIDKDEESVRTDGLLRNVGANALEVFEVEEILSEFRHR